MVWNVMIPAQLYRLDNLACRYSVARRIPGNPPTLMTQQLGANILGGKDRPRRTNIALKVRIARSKGRFVQLLRQSNGLGIIARSLSGIKPLNDIDLFCDGGGRDVPVIGMGEQGNPPLPMNMLNKL
jgi:hypothetical protein